MIASKQRKILWWIIGGLAVVVAGLRIFQHSYRGQDRLPVLGVVPEFSFITEAKDGFSRNNLLGKITIADFIFTTCAGPCPLMSGQMQQLQKSFERQDHLQFTSFSVDPENDTPAVLAEYAQRFGAQHGKWFFLTGEKKAMYQLIIKGFHLAVESDEDTVLHSTKFVLVDLEGNIRGYYEREDEEAMKDLVNDATRLLQEL